MLNSLMSPWYVVLTEPQQEMPCVWRAHLLGLELFTPVINRRIKTGRVHNGRHITRLVARPMFPSYGFVRQAEIRDTDEILSLRGVRDFLRVADRRLVTLPHEAVLAVFDKQQEERTAFLAAARCRYFAGNLKGGDLVRVNDGGVYSGLMASVDRVDAKGRIQVLFGMIRHTLPPDMVVAF
jgi:transcription antitermination factor NusG